MPEQGEPNNPDQRDENHSPLDGARWSGSLQQGEAMNWKVTEEERGLVRVFRGTECVAFCWHIGDGRIKDIEFARDEYRKSNPTRQKVARMLQSAGYK